MRIDLSRWLRRRIRPEKGVGSGRGVVGRSVLAVLAAVGLFAAAAAEARAEEPKLTLEYLQKHHPDLFREIQAAPRLPPEKEDPDKLYADYPGFFAQPVLKQGQVEEWWENSSFDYQPMYPYLLKHTHMKFSYAKSTGNEAGSAVKGGLMLALRKGRFTNVIGYEIDKKKISTPDGGNVDTNIQSAEETALYELNRWLYLEAGMIWQRMSYQFILDRWIPFVGLGSYNVLQDVLDPKKDRLKLGLGYGRVKDVYYSQVVDLIDRDSDTFNAAYLKAEFTHKFTDMLTYKQDFTLKHALDKTAIYSMTTIPQLAGDEQFAIVTGSTRRYDWRWANSLEFALNAWVGFLVSYEVAFDSNPWPVAAKRDTTMLTGFKFAY